MSNSTSLPSGASSMIESARPDFDPIAHLPESVAPYLTDTLESVETYAREKPWSFALWMIGLGFVIGWKIKPW